MALFLSALLRMSLTAGAAVCVVLLLRLLLRRAPRIFSYALWGVVLFRLLCPAAPPLGLSLFGLPEALGAERGEAAAQSAAPSQVWELTPADGGRAPAEADGPAAAPETGPVPVPAADPGPEAGGTAVTAAGLVWAAGAAALAARGIGSYVRLRRRLRGAVPLGEGVWLAGSIPSPFVLGFLRPRIYLPAGLEEGERGYILLHERIHIRRGDHIFRLLAYGALCLHWFNPLVWLAFLLAGRDMELSCDEAVIRRLGEEVRADYAASLLRLAGGSGPVPAFGSGDTGGRIRHLAAWRRPGRQAILAGAAVCAAAALCLLTNPAGQAGPAEGELVPGQIYVPRQCIYMSSLSSYAAFGGDSGCRYLVEEDAFTFLPREVPQATRTIPVEDWGWRSFPYTDRQWADLYGWEALEVPQAFTGQFDELLWQPLGADCFLLRADGEIWLAELKAGSLWSIYSLAPEDEVGTALWTYSPEDAPLLSLAFDFGYTQITALCVDSPLTVSGASGGTASGIQAVLEPGGTLCWSPLGEDGRPVTRAKISFSVWEGEEVRRNGTLYLDAGEGPGGERTYTVSLTGAGLYLEPNPGGAGIVVTAAP